MPRIDPATVILELNQIDSLTLQHLSSALQHLEIVSLSIDLDQDKLLDSLLSAVSINGCHGHRAHTPGAAVSSWINAIAPDVLPVRVEVYLARSCGQRQSIRHHS